MSLDLVMTLANEPAVVLLTITALILPFSSLRLRIVCYNHPCDGVY